jgi:beta-glucosidase
MNRSIIYSLVALLLLWSCQSGNEKTISTIALEKTAVKAEANGSTFRDLNKNGKMDVYEDINAPIEDRITDLIAQMTVEEKAGMMFMPGVPVNEDGSLKRDTTATGPGARYPIAIDNISKGKLNHFNVWGIPSDPTNMALWYNNLQNYAEKESRLGIPVSIASDPRHHFSNTIFSMAANGFSQFCETPGLAAIGNDSLVEVFADIVRKEYLAVGIRVALHPQIDLSTEPRWARISGTFGEDAELTARMVTAYIKGLQGSELSSESVAAMTKHFPGGGPQKEGLDPHFAIQKGQIYPGDNFDYHLIPFEAAFKVNTASIMPYYGRPMGQTDEDVAMAFNKAIITDLLRTKYEYDGVVCTDWGLLTDVPMGPVIWPARAWGVEDLSVEERVFKVIDAGCDQFGGENRPEVVAQLINEGKISQERIDESIRRLLRQKFKLGLFDNPFVDETQVAQEVGKAAYRKLGDEAQQKAMTLLKNEEGTLPLAANSQKVYIEGMDSAVVATYAQVVSTPEEADLAIIRLNAPWYPADTQNPFARMFHHGDLDFKGEAKEKVLNVLNKVPTIVDIYLDRPAVIPEIAMASKALIADFGANDKNVCEVIFGNAQPQGKLPFELPSSMEAVENQLTDVPYDSENPLYAFGFGLSY